MDRRCSLIILLAMAMAINSAAIHAADDTAAETEAQAAFKSLYGEEVARAAKTGTTLDDVKLAGKLLDAAGASRNDPKLLKLICDKAYDLGKKSSAGYDVAIEAMNVLSAHVPEARTQCLDKAVTVHQLRYSRSRLADRPALAGALLDAMVEACDANAQAGNIAAAKLQCMKASRLAALAKLPQKQALQARYRELLAAERSMKLIAGYKARLKVDPSNVAAREALVKTYLIDKNDPAEAAKWLNEDCDQRFRTYIPMAAGDINAIPEATLVEMGDWYKSLAAGAPLVSKGGLLLRAKAFYELFIEKHAAGDLAKTKAIIALAKIRSDIKKYGVKVPTKVATAAVATFTGISRRASVTNPPKISGVKAWSVELRDYLGRFYDVEFSKDSTQLITAGQDGSIRFWDAATGKQLRTLMGHDSEVRTLAWSRGHKLLASGSGDKTIRLWDLETGKTTAILRGSSEAVYRIAWSPDSLSLASSGRSSSVNIWSLRSGKAIGKLRATDGVRGLGWSVSGTLAIGASDGKVSLWNVRTGKPYGHYPLSQYKYKSKIRTHAVYSLAYSPVNSRLIAVGFSNGSIKLWKAGTKSFSQSMTPVNKTSKGKNRIGYPSCIEWSPDARTIAVGDYGSYGGTVWFWNASGAKKHKVAPDARASISNLAWSPDGKFVATAPTDSTSSLIDSQAGEVVRKITSARPKGAVQPIFSPDGSIMAYACRDKTIRFWDLVKCKQISVIAAPSKTSRYLTHMRWSPDAAKIAFIYYKNATVYVVDVKTGVVSASLAGSITRLNGVAWSADSKKLFVSHSAQSSDQVGAIRVWDVATSKVEYSLSSKKISSHYGLLAAPGGKLLASSASQGKIHLWSLEGKAVVRTIPADEQRVRCMTFSPDGKTLATCGDEPTVKVWSVSTGKPIYGLKKHESDVYSLAFSPDGSKLASAGERYKVGVWDMKDGKILSWFGGSNWELRWMKDSKTLAAASGSGVSFFNAANGARKGVYYPMPKGKGVIISSIGHYSGTPEVEKDLIYQALTVSGQSMLTQEEFTEKYGWKNDPSKVKLIETAARPPK